MIDIANWTWEFDKAEMLCRNEANQVSVKIEKDGRGIRGKILDMPMELFGKFAEIPNGAAIIAQIVSSAEEEYYRVSASGFLKA